MTDTRGVEIAALEPQRRQSNDWLLRNTVIGLVALAALTSIGPFGTDVIPALGERLANIQQLVAVACWALVGLISLFLQAQQPRALPALSLVALYMFALISVAWAYNPLDAGAKASTLIFVGGCVYSCSAKLEVSEFLAAVRFSAILLCLASFAIVVVSPSVGITLHYEHVGEWEGIFGSKQNLGFAGAIVIFVSAAQLISESFRLRWRSTFILPLYITIGLIACSGSGSRGGAVIAILAVISLAIGRSSRITTRLVALAPLFIFAFATCALAYLAVSGADHFTIGSSEVNLTRRTLIWHDALTRWAEQAAFGFGINGYWTRPYILEEFKYYNGWALDNFHSGYLTVLIELGIVGYAIFGLMTIGYIKRLINIARLLKEEQFATLTCVGLPLIMYTINFSETFFLRSTNLFQALFLFMFFKTSHMSRQI